MFTKWIVSVAMSALVATLTTTSAGARAASDEWQPADWTKAAHNDVEAMHAILSDDHPGGADPKNPNFKIWLERGRRLAHQRADQIAGYAGYLRALQFYSNGFRDGHIDFFTFSSRQIWPGFLTRLTNDGRTIVSVVGDGLNLKAGSQLVSCDGKSPVYWYGRRVAPYYVNADIPHDRFSKSVYLFAGLEGEASVPRTCIFRNGKKPSVIRLNWRSVDSEQLDKFLSTALGESPAETGLRVVNGVTFITASSFNVFDSEADSMRALIAKIKSDRAMIFAAPIVVIDVRGNRGGNSSWGDQIVKALWGETNFKTVFDSFDQATEWRASDRNIRLTRVMAKRSHDAGLVEDADYRDAMAANMAKAIASKQDYVAEVQPAAIAIKPSSLTQPFSGKVYFLTDYSCASACLDFSDLVTRMPEVVHIGLPTSADAVYIDNVQETLPSGVGQLSYSVKVFRNRVRSNNQWYSPRYEWSGGAMTDQNVAAWIKTLPRH